MKYTVVISTLLLVGLFGAINSSSLWAEDSAGLGISGAEPRHAEEPAVYTANRISLQLVSGMFFSPVRIGHHTPPFNFSQTNIRVGWMVHDPFKSVGFLNGNIEALLEFSGSYVTKSFGSYLVGSGLFLRYNFVQYRWRFVPYVQAGGGFAYTDAYKDTDQRALGGALEFTPQASFGFHYQCARKWSVDAEGSYHHISDANLAPRNRGINALGGFIGVTHFF